MVSGPDRSLNRIWLYLYRHCLSFRILISKFLYPSLASSFITTCHSENGPQCPGQNSQLFIFRSPRPLFLGCQKIGLWLETFIVRYIFSCFDSVFPLAGRNRRSKQTKNRGSTRNQTEEAAENICLFYFCFLGPWLKHLLANLLIVKMGFKRPFIIIA